MKKIIRMIKKYDYGDQVSFSSLNDINLALDKAMTTYNEFKKTVKDGYIWKVLHMNTVK